MDRTKDIDRIDHDVDIAIRDLDPREALEFVEELTSRLDGKVDGLRDDIKALEDDDGDGA